MDEDLLEKVVDKINEELGNDVSNFSRCQELYEKLLEEKNSIEKLLSMASSAAPSKVNAAVREVETVGTDVNSLISNYDELSVQVQTQLGTAEPLASQLQTEVEKVETLENCLSYLHWIQEFEGLSTELETAHQSKNERKSVYLLHQMSEKRGLLKHSACLHLVSFVTETLHFWHGLIKDKLSNEFDEVLKLLKWPFVGGSQVLASAPSPDTLQRFETLVELLLKLEQPEAMGDVSQSASISSATSALLVDFAPPPLPLQLMVSPLRKRFLYHFSGSRQTNKIEKPEWYMAQVLAWVRDHSQFVSQWVQPVLLRVLGSNCELVTNVEFTRALVQLVLEKLHSDLPALEQDDALFAHALDETLSFDRELRSLYAYPPSQPGVVSVLTQAPIFLKWIDMEKKYARERMDRMLSSETAWQQLSQDDQDELRVTECAEGFLTLLMTMTNRFRNLPQPGHRLQFLALQLELLDEFRIRLQQVLNHEQNDFLHSQLPAMLNTISYISSVLQEWGELPHFLQLQYYREQDKYRESNADRVEAISVQCSVFDEPLELLESLATSQLNSLVDASLMEVKARSREYRKDKWFSMSVAPDERYVLTSSACGMFRVLSARLLELKDLLARSLFFRAWQSLADQLGRYLLEEVVMQNWFSEGGAKQLQHDMVHGLFPLFGQFTPRPDNHFKQMKEACILLNLAAGSARLTVEAIEHSSAKGDVDPREVLAEAGVHLLEPEQALNILIRRNDIRADHGYD